MKPKIETAARYILGLLFFVFGLNGFLQFIPPPADGFPEGAMAFFNGMMAAPYFFPLLKGTEVLCGLMLLANVAPALSLVILAPITTQIFCFHAFMTPGVKNLVMPVAIIVLHVLAACKYKDRYRPLFSK